MMKLAHPFTPKLPPQFSASVPNMSRRTATGQFTFPPVEQTPVPTTRPPTDANVPAQRARGLNGRDIKVFPQLFLLYQSVYQDNDCHITTQYLPTPQKKGE
jgi:hypothetical protein